MQTTDYIVLLFIVAIVIASIVFRKLTVAGALTARFYWQLCCIKAQALPVLLCWAHSLWPVLQQLPLAAVKRTIRHCRKE